MQSPLSAIPTRESGRRVTTPDMVDAAGLDIHRLFAAKGFRYSFMRGWALVAAIGVIRSTDNVNVMVNKPFFGGKKKVIRTLNRLGVLGDFYVVIDEAEPMIARHRRTEVEVRIHIRNRLPQLRRVLFNKNGELVPFLPTVDLFIDKSRMCAVRLPRKVDGEDLLALFRIKNEDLLRGRDEIHKALVQEQVTYILDHYGESHPALQDFFVGLGYGLN